MQAGFGDLAPYVLGLGVRHCSISVISFQLCFGQSIPHNKKRQGTSGFSWQVNSLEPPPQMQERCYDHARRGSAPAHLAVEDEGRSLWWLPQPPHQKGKVLFLGSLFICYGDPCILNLIAVVYTSNASVSMVLL